ncbi:hypothetical protein [Chryseobacterium indoltheticum]|uniref:hypothetical protein n=1 Tax=Chryseobacterium indoltheticum TaxID=254 RepID=UPI003F494D33
MVTFAVLSSCMVRKEYERPAAGEADDENYSETDMLPQDSTKWLAKCFVERDFYRSYSSGTYYKSFWKTILM